MYLKYRMVFFPNWHLKNCMVILQSCTKLNTFYLGNELITQHSEGGCHIHSLILYLDACAISQIELQYKIITNDTKRM